MSPPPGTAPDVTVSIVNASSRETLVALLESLEPDREGPLSVEVVVLDNASDDGSPEAVRERFPWARVIAQPYRAGFGANHNRVIRATSGRYVYVLSHDAAVEPRSLEAMVAYLDSHPHVAMLAPRIVYPDGTPQASAWRFPSPAVAALGTLTLSRVGVVQSHGSGPHRIDWAMGCALLVRRAALDGVGLFDEAFFMYSEEVDLARRLRDAGYETHFFPLATVLHHDSRLRADVPTERINEEWRSRLRYWRKHHSALGARLASTLTGLQYAARAGIAAALLRLPPGRRPLAVEPRMPARMRHHARCALRGVPGPGLRESAEEWNRTRGSTPSPTPRSR
jgi:N-acetylglucosaminyl-diphospho-decaprenol L-rhamnosyltransferase